MLTVRGTVIPCDDLIGRSEGRMTPPGEPERFRVLRAGYAELVQSIERPAEPIFAKDTGAIIVRGDIHAGDRVIEVGIGAGALTIALLHAVGPTGHLYSYELREDFARAAEQNVARYYGLAPQWSLRVRDARDGFDEADVDRLVTDVPEPCATIDCVARALRAGGTYIGYLPTVLQVKTLHDRLRGDPRFCLIDTIELLERGWYVDDRSMRPEHRMVAHTGFLTFARRTADD
jgi:tRNA (adenine57-N1/adenine58-N1)-methyltransferase